MDLALTNIHVLITGAAGGIGITTVREFLAHGALVTAQYRSTRAALDEAFAGEIKQGRVQCLQADVTREEDVEVLFKEAEKGMMGKPVSVLIGTFSFPWATTPLTKLRSQPCDIRIHPGTTTRDVPRAMESHARDQLDGRVLGRKGVYEAFGQGEAGGRRGERGVEECGGRFRRKYW